MQIVRNLNLSLIATCLCLFPGIVGAVGEIFLVETSGLESCGDFNHLSFNAKNNIDLYARIDSDSQLSISLSPNFPNDETTLPLQGLTYLKTNKTANFVGHASLTGDAFVSIQGIATADRFGGVASLRGRFIQLGLFHSTCYSNGRFITKRLN